MRLTLTLQDVLLITLTIWQHKPGGQHSCNLWRKIRRWRFLIARSQAEVTLLARFLFTILGLVICNNYSPNTFKVIRINVGIEELYGPS